MNDISKKTFIWAIIGLILLRIILIVLVMNNIPFTGMTADGFRPTFTESYHPDEDEIFDIARAVASGTVANRVPNLGYPLFIAPIVYFKNAITAWDITEIVFILQAFILLSLAIILVALLGKKIFSSRKLAVIGAMLFTVYPWLLLGFFKLIGYDNAIPAFHYQLWMFILTDYLSALSVYLSFYLIFRILSKIDFEKIILNRFDLILLGIFSSYALLTRIGNVWLFLIILAVFFWFRKFKDIMIYLSVFIVAYLPQFIYNALTFGAPWRYGYAYADRYINSNGAGFGWHNIFNVYFKFSKLWLNFENFSPDYYIALFIFSSVFLILISVIGFEYLKKINKLFAVITIVWFWSYTLFYWSFDISLSQLRYFLPAVPVFIFLFIGAMIYVMNKIYEYKQLSYSENIG